jgi:hypothetical protein
MARRRRVPAQSWINVFYAEADRSVPARTFLDECPPTARQTLLAIVVAVRDAPPPSFPASMHWHVMTRDMRGIYEARDRQGNLLYRLFCLLDRKAPEHGLSAPALVLLSGGVKPVREEMDPRTYAAVRKQRDRYLSSSPRPIAKS